MDQWFIALDKDNTRDKAIEQLSNVNFIPEWGEKRMRAAKLKIDLTGVSVVNVLGVSPCQHFMMRMAMPTLMQKLLNKLRIK